MSKLTLVFANDRLEADIESGVVARIQGFPSSADASDEEPYYREVVVPVGRDGITLEVPAGRYRVQALLPSGRILQEDRYVQTGDQIPVNFDAGPSPRGWLGWTSFGGNSPNPDALEHQPARRGSATRGWASISQFRDLPRLDRQGVGYLVGSLGHALLDATVGQVSRVPELIGVGPDRGARLDCITCPTASEGGDSWAEIANPADVLRKRASASETAPSPQIELVENEGAVRLWRVRHAAEQFEPRHWAVMEAADTVELGSLPLPWLDLRSGEYIKVEALVDESSARSGARMVLTMPDPTLGGLLAYIGRGRIGAAQVLVDSLANEGLIERTIAQKEGNPLAACAAAYAGLAMFDPAERERWDGWLSNCMNRFPWLPDAAIAHARRIILRPSSPGENEQALDALKTAYRRGIPYFSAGVQHLRDGLMMLGGKDAEAEAMLEAVRRVASRIDLGQTFTVLRFPKS
jgi:hypothetical protein